MSMTKKDVKLATKAIIRILKQYPRKEEIDSYIESDIRMQVSGDLEALRKKNFPLPYSGVVDPDDQKLEMQLWLETKEIL